MGNDETKSRTDPTGEVCSKCKWSEDLFRDGVFCRVFVFAFLCVDRCLLIHVVR